ncbi:hypothetical protein GCM10009634_86880 [Saccharothrix xinjiangensis]
MSAARKPVRARPEATSPLAGTRAPLVPNVEPLRVGDTHPSPPADSQSHRVTESQTLSVREPSEQPRYLTLVRKEARLRPDQATALADLRRRLARSRTDRSETITDNTLLRIAVDLLLAHADRLHGDTEEQLTESALRST